MKKNTLIAAIILIAVIAGVVYIYRNRAKYRSSADEILSSESSRDLQDIFAE